MTSSITDHRFYQLIFLLPVAAATDDLKEWTEAVRTGNDDKLMSLKSDVGDDFQESAEAIGQLLEAVGPLETAFQTFKEKGSKAAEAIHTILDLIPKVNVQVQNTSVEETLRGMSRWFEERSKSLQVTPSEDILETMRFGAMVASRVADEVHNLKYALHDAAKLLQEMKAAGDNGTRGEQVGRLAVSYYGQAGKASDQIQLIGTLFVAIASVGHGNDK